MHGRRTLLVFVKYPEPGRVKTRLARTVGPEHAALLYRQWIGSVLGGLQPLRTTTRVVGFFDGAPREAFRDWHRLADDWWPQPGGDLEDRLVAGFEAGLDAGGPVLAVGTDCLELEPELVAEAFEALSNHDVVFGPTSDGGYYLVGTSRSRPALFRSVRWSSPFTLADHLRRCDEERWPVALLPVRHDIDTWDDWQAYLARAEGRGARDEGQELSSLAPRPSPLAPHLTLAVVIPTLNEEVALPGLLASLHAQSRPAERVVVADGGSTDRTVSVARQSGAEVLLTTGRGRGGQVAAAVATLTEEIVLVAHADMRLPREALEWVRRSLAEGPDCPGGCLGHRFDRTSLVLRAVEWWDRRRARRGESYGDQAQFFRRQLLQSADGFPDQPIMEDVELSRRLRSLGVPLYLDVPVTVSARRFDRLGWWRVLWTNWVLRRRYRRGGLAACPALYARYYPETGARR